MGEVIWIEGATWGTEWDEHVREWRETLAAKMDAEFVNTLNREVNNNGWVTARSIYLRLLRDELDARGFDYSAVDGLTSFPGNRRFALRGRRLVYQGGGRDAQS